MLVLSRRVAESIQIGDQIELEVLDISGNQVKLGIRAPRSVSVLRSELVITMRPDRVAPRPLAARMLGSVPRVAES
jgi:carbon storage regulator